VLIFAGAFQRWKIPIAAIWLAISASNEFFFENTVIRILFITNYAPLFAAGILAEDIVARGRSPAAFLLLAVAFLVSCQTIIFSHNWMHEHFGAAISYPALLAANIVVYGVFSGAILLRSVIAPSKVVMMLGGLTYPLYLLHQYIGYISLNALAPHVGKNAAFFVVFAGILLASFLVWRFIETPVRKPLVRALVSGIYRLAPASQPIRPTSSARTS
jgi:peptidoglycan/LPS O-acetylase OafA/YrhL